ncbi:Zinc finger protein 254 [Eumeta japonica]|uniref:Zinc finger protein 865 n=1 Tax=Eumeta variegata TaxID=151549 RepID=A0A4C1ZFD9_EUMVA|nr:Zinc finger protein 254 [Eumeta japonica]
MSETNSSYCRLCAEDKPTAKLIDLATDETLSEEVINKLALLNVLFVDISQNVKLPKTVCIVCVETLNKACDFVLNIQKAQVTLTNIFENKIKAEASDHSDDGDSNGDYDFDIDLKDVKTEDVNIKTEDEEESSSRKHRGKHKKSSTSSRAKLKQVNCATWQEYSWLCAYCGSQFPTVDDLKDHSMKFHESCTAYRCSDCNLRKLNLNAFLKHVMRHRHLLKFSCYVCGKEGSGYSAIKKHLTTHTKNAKHICYACNSVFPNEEELSDHITKFLRDRRIKRFVACEENTAEFDPICKVCQKTFKTRGNLLAHMQIHTERRRDYTCDKCGKRFYNKGTLNSHMLGHDDTRPFKCEICNSAFKTNGQLRSHVGIHGGPRPYACEQCGRCFRLRRHLNSHLIIHTDSLPHICEYCSKAFRFKTILTQHLRQHTGAKPYTCDQCNRDFTNWPNYNKHMKRRHGMDMSKKKHTPEGVFPVNPLTGELQILPPFSSETDEWRRKLMVHRKPGRPKALNVEEDTKPDLESLENKSEPEMSNSDLCDSVQ